MLTCCTVDQRDDSRKCGTVFTLAQVPAHMQTATSAQPRSRAPADEEARRFAEPSAWLLPRLKPLLAAFWQRLNKAEPDPAPASSTETPGAPEIVMLPVVSGLPRNAARFVRRCAAHLDSFDRAVQLHRRLKKLKVGSGPIAVVSAAQYRQTERCHTPMSQLSPW